MQEKKNSPSQPHQNKKGMHEMEAKEGESSMVKEVKAVITLRSGKEVDLPTSKLEHDEETHASTFVPSFVWENHTNQVSSEGCKLQMGSGQAKLGSNFLMDLVFLKTS